MNPKQSAVLETANQLIAQYTQLKESGEATEERDRHADVIKALLVALSTSGRCNEIGDAIRRFDTASITNPTQLGDIVGHGILAVLDSGLEDEYAALMESHSGELENALFQTYKYHLSQGDPSRAQAIHDQILATDPDAEKTLTKIRKRVERDQSESPAHKGQQLYTLSVFLTRQGLEAERQTCEALLQEFFPDFDPETIRRRTAEGSIPDNPIEALHSGKLTPRQEDQLVHDLIRADRLKKALEILLIVEQKREKTLANFWGVLFNAAIKQRAIPLARQIVGHTEDPIKRTQRLKRLGNVMLDMSSTELQFSRFEKALAILEEVENAGVVPKTTLDCRWQQAFNAATLRGDLEMAQRITDHRRGQIPPATHEEHIAELEHMRTAQHAPGGSTSPRASTENQVINRICAILNRGSQTGIARLPDLLIRARALRTGTNLPLKPLILRAFHLALKCGEEEIARIMRTHMEPLDTKSAAYMTSILTRRAAAIHAGSAPPRVRSFGRGVWDGIHREPANELAARGLSSRPRRTSQRRRPGPVKIITPTPAPPPPPKPETIPIRYEFLLDLFEDEEPNQAFSTAEIKKITGEPHSKVVTALRYFRTRPRQGQQIIQVPGRGGIPRWQLVTISE